MMRRRVSRLALGPVFAGLLIVILACDVSSLSSVIPTIEWPFDTSAGTWKIFHGYNVADHTGYQLDSMDFVLNDGTTGGQSVLSPVAGDLVPFGPASHNEGVCVSISIANHDGYHLMVCHIDLTHDQGTVSIGDTIGTVNTHGDPDHIHITLYYLDPSQFPNDNDPNNRKNIAFAGDWNIGGCNYPEDSSQNQWAETTVPC